MPELKDYRATGRSRSRLVRLHDVRVTCWAESAERERERQVK